MSLDPAPSDEDLRRIATERLHRRNGVALGPDSPLRSGKRDGSATKARRAKAELAVARDYEHEEQSALFRWADEHAAELPDLAKLFAVPNGGYRNIRTAGRLRAEGVKPGIPDLFLLVPRGEYHGLLLEMKRPGGAVSPSQADWHFIFTKDGYRVVIATTWEMARDHILQYLEMPTQ